MTVEHGEALAWLNARPDGEADAIVTDPPYSSGGQFRSDRAGKSANEKYIGQANGHEFGGDSRDQRGYLAWCTLWLSEALRVTRAGGHLVMFTDWRQLPTVTDAVQCAGWVWRGVGVWEKPTARPNRGGFSHGVEFMVHATAGPADLREVYLPAVIRVKLGDDERAQHLTAKPVVLLRQLVRLAARGALVVDPFAGSGSTGVACVMEGRRFAGCEIDASYAENARVRIAEHAHAVSALEGDPAHLCR